VTVAFRPASYPGDEDAVLAVVDVSFRDETRDASEELAIVRGTWAACEAPARIEVVGDDAGVVVAHALAAPGRIEGSACTVAGVAPVCVAPSHQGRGVGTALLRALLDEATARRWPLLVLLGEPGFYGRAGFGQAAALGLHYAPAGPASPHFLSRRLTDGATPRGQFTYCWED
jgi:putative acetyltransferase